MKVVKEGAVERNKYVYDGEEKRKITLIALAHIKNSAKPPIIAAETNICYDIQSANEYNVEVQMNEMSSLTTRVGSIILLFAS